MYAEEMRVLRCMYYVTHRNSVISEYCVSKDEVESYVRKDEVVTIIEKRVFR